MPTPEQDERLSTELELLESMYPDQVIFDQKARELSYTIDSGKLVLRLPDGYLSEALPEVLSATAGKSDVRDVMKQKVAEGSVGEEVLDSILLAFNDVVESSVSTQPQPNAPTVNDNALEDSKATIIVWLHHLLNTNKRKQALSPPSDAVSGIAKPGYPGVLVYSGPSKAVHEHVNELKQLNWQAFQVRLETEEEWRFEHGSGVIEVEAMKDVVADVGEERKQVFMEAMKIK